MDGEVWYIVSRSTASCEQPLRLWCRICRTQCEMHSDKRKIAEETSSREVKGSWFVMKTHIEREYAYIHVNILHDCRHTYTRRSIPSCLWRHAEIHTTSNAAHISTTRRACPSRQVFRLICNAQMREYGVPCVDVVSVRMFVVCMDVRTYVGMYVGVYVCRNVCMQVCVRLSVWGHLRQEVGM